MRHGKRSSDPFPRTRTWASTASRYTIKHVHHKCPSVQFPLTYIYIHTHPFMGQPRGCSKLSRSVAGWVIRPKTYDSAKILIKWLVILEHFRIWNELGKKILELWAANGLYMFIPALPARYSPGGKTKCLRRRCSLARIGVASTKQGVYLQHPGNQAHVLWDFQGASLITLLNQYQPLFYLPQRLTSWPIQKQKNTGHPHAIFSPLSHGRLTYTTLRWWAPASSYASSS